jgi:hypothetical protein
MSYLIENLKPVDRYFVKLVEKETNPQVLALLKEGCTLLCSA